MRLAVRYIPTGQQPESSTEKLQTGARGDSSITDRDRKLFEEILGVLRLKGVDARRGVAGWGYIYGTDDPGCQVPGCLHRGVRTDSAGL